MARYFFDVHDTHLSAHDYEGTECLDRAAVKTEALRALCQIAEDHPDRYAGQGLNVVVRNSADQSVLTATLNLSASWHPKHARDDAA